MISFSLSRPSGLFTDTRLGPLAAILGLLLVLAQVVSATHFILVPHAIDAHTGKVVRCHRGHEDSSSDDCHSKSKETPPDNPSSEEQECQVYVLLHMAKAPGASAPTIEALAIASPQVLFLSRDIPFRVQRLYLLSPSQSPPNTVAA